MKVNFGRGEEGQEDTERAGDGDAAECSGPAGGRRHGGQPTPRRTGNSSPRDARPTTQSGHLGAMRTRAAVTAAAQRRRIRCHRCGFGGTGGRRQRSWPTTENSRRTARIRTHQHGAVGQRQGASSAVGEVGWWGPDTPSSTPDLGGRQPAGAPPSAALTDRARRPATGPPCASPPAAALPAPGEPASSPDRSTATSTGPPGRREGPRGRNSGCNSERTSSVRAAPGHDEPLLAARPRGPRRPRRRCAATPRPGPSWDAAGAAADWPRSARSAQRTRSRAERSARACGALRVAVAQHREQPVAVVEEEEPGRPGPAGSAERVADHRGGGGDGVPAGPRGPPRQVAVLVVGEEPRVEQARPAASISARSSTPPPLNPVTAVGAPCQLRHRGRVVGLTEVAVVALRRRRCARCPAR